MHHEKKELAGVLSRLPDTPRHWDRVAVICYLAFTPGTVSNGLRECCLLREWVLINQNAHNAGYTAAPDTSRYGSGKIIVRSPIGIEPARSWTTGSLMQEMTGSQDIGPLTPRHNDRGSLNLLTAHLPGCDRGILLPPLRGTSYSTVACSQILSRTRDCAALFRCPMIFLSIELIALLCNLLEMRENFIFYVDVCSNL